MFQLGQNNIHGIHGLDSHAGMFRLWRQKMADEATYLRLAEGLEELKLRGIIIDLLDLFCAHAQTIRQQHQVTVVPKLGMYYNT